MEWKIFLLCLYNRFIPNLAKPEPKSGVLSCYGRLVLKGTLPTVCYAQGMTSYLLRNNILLFDYTKFADPLREKIRTNAEHLAASNNLTIEFIRSSKARKEDIVKKYFDGKKTGLIYILSAIEACPSYVPWYDKVSHKTFLKGAQGKCLHYYFYFNDPDIGFGYVRVPTWCPFQLQVYFNGIICWPTNLPNMALHLRCLIMPLIIYCRF